MNENLYEILGLNKNATAEEIKASSAPCFLTENK